MRCVSEEVILAPLTVSSINFLDFFPESLSPQSLLRHSSLLSSLRNQSGGVMRRQGTCYVNLTGKSLDIFG